MKGFIYILEDENKRFYIGSTSNVPRRIEQHRTGHTQTTSRMKNPRLVLVQEYSSLEQARRIERKIKNLKRKDYIEKMIAEGVIKMEV